MERERIQSSNIYSTGHDETGMEVQFHKKSGRVPLPQRAGGAARTDAGQPITRHVPASPHKEGGHSGPRAEVPREEIVKVTLESTTQIVALVVNVNADAIECRVWEGLTESGIHVQALIPRIAVHKKSDCSQFEAELVEKHRPASPDFEAFPLRMIL